MSLNEFMQLWPLISALLIMLWLVVKHEFAQSRQIKVLEATVLKFSDYENLEKRVTDLEKENQLYRLKLAEQRVISIELKNLIDGTRKIYRESGGEKGFSEEST